jgi:hypothetical protein
MKDVFKYLRRADSYIREAKEESQGHKQAVQAGGVTSSYGRYYDKDGKYIGKVVGDKWQAAKPEEMMSRMAGSEAGQADAEPQSKTLDQFRQTADQSQMNRNVPGGPTADALASGDKAEVEKQLSRGRENVQSPNRKAQISRQADQMIAQDQAEREAAAAAEAEAQAQEEIPQEEPLKPAEDYPTLDDTYEAGIEDGTIEEPEDDDEDFMDEEQQIQQAFEDAVKDITERQRKNMEKKFETFRSALGNVPAGEGRNGFMKAMAHAKTFEGRVNAGAGKNNLGYADVQNLMANRDRLMEGYGDGSPEAIKKFVRSVRSNEVSDEFVDASFDVLPASFQKSLSGKGQVTNDAYVSDDKAHKDIHYLGKNEDGTIRRGAASNKDRAKLMWRIYLEQGGRDAYTGLPLDLQAMDLEHVRGFNNKDGGKPSKEQWEQRENDDNFTLINSNINQKKVDLSMKDFFEREVDPHKDKTEDQFGGIEKLFEKQNQIGSVADELVQTLRKDGGGLTDDVTSEILTEHFNNDDNEYTNLRDEFRKVATDDKDKKKAAGMKSKIGKSLLKAIGLSRGITDTSGRRTVALQENVYRGFLRSMANAEPADRQRYMDGWAEAIKAGNEERSPKAVNRKLIELGLIDKDILDDRKAGKVFKEEYDESLRTSKTYGKSFIRKYHKDNKYL